MNKFEMLCSLLPEDVNWSDPVTPQMIEQIVMAERNACLSAVRNVMVTDHSMNTWKRCVAAIEKRSNV